MQFRVYNKTLDKNLWDNNKKLYPEIRSTVLQIANDYYRGNDILDGSLVDVYLVGSSANYNWTPDSDLDIHLVLDSEKIGYDEETARTIFELMSHKWNQLHDIKIKGHRVELYLQDINHQLKSSGIYSVLDDMWVKEPHPEDIEIDHDFIIKKFFTITDRIKKAIASEDVTLMKKVMDNVRSMRNTGLKKEGEYSAENICFKMLRKFGYIKKLKDSTRKIYDREMTLTEKLKDPTDLIIGYVTPSLKVKSKTSKEIKLHSEFGEVTSWFGVNAWRFRRDLNILFWWKPHEGEINQNERDAVIDYLERKYEAKNIKQRVLTLAGREPKATTFGSNINTTNWELSHGIEESLLTKSHLLCPQSHILSNP